MNQAVVTQSELDREALATLHNTAMRIHQVRWRLRRLSGPQLVGLGVAVFVTVVVLGLYGPGLIALAHGRMVSAEANAPPPITSRYFRSCAAAHAAGVFSIPRGAPEYRPALDSDGDGIACEPYLGG